MKRILFGLFAGLIAASASPQLRHLPANDEPEPGRDAERELSLPALPRQENLIEFYVSATASNRFFIDAASLSVGPDGVVRYSLVVKAAGGATNISFEGMRCGSGEYKILATGRNDGIWAKARTDAWRPIENKPINRHHAALNRDFFCPNGLPVANMKEAVDALRHGQHPLAQ